MQINKNQEIFFFFFFFMCETLSEKKNVERNVFLFYLKKNFQLVSNMIITFFSCVKFEWAEILEGKNLMI